jgi:hypothetical protein
MKKPRYIKDNTHLFAQRAEKKAEQLSTIARQEAMRQLGKAYDDWRKRVVIQSRKPEELPELLNLLVWEAQNILKGTGAEAESLLENFTKLLDHNIAVTFQFAQAQKLFIRVLADCPNQRPKVIGVDAEDAPNSIECGWGGMMYVPRHKFDDGSIAMECPQCKNLLKKGDMIDAATKVVEQANQAVKFRPAHNRGSKILPKDIYEFLTTEQLLEFTWVALYADKPGFVRYGLGDTLENGAAMLFAVFEDGRSERIGAIRHAKAVSIPPLTPPAAQPASPEAQPLPPTTDTGEPAPAP